MKLSSDRSIEIYERCVTYARDNSAIKSPHKTSVLCQPFIGLVTVKMECVTKLKKLLTVFNDHVPGISAGLCMYHRRWIKCFEKLFWLPGLQAWVRREWVRNGKGL
jgi:hypothetical protein